MRRYRLATSQKGFTIVELLISSLVFSLVLLTVTIGVIQITRVYYKGITESTAQNAARDALDTISQAIQFNGGEVSKTNPSAPGNWATFCGGGQQFSYRLGYQLVDGTLTPGKHQTASALLMSPNSSCSGNPGALTTGRELLGPKMRLANLQVTDQGNNLYKITIRVVYGDDDLLFSPSGGTDTAADAKCKATAGSQFCSVSELTTTVVKRVQ